MDGDLSKPILGVVLAIAITTAMDATGYTMLSALPLFPLAALFWWWQRFSRREIGLTAGNAAGYAFALLHSVFVIGAIIGIAWIAGAIDTSEAEWDKVGLNLGVGSSIGILMVLITEEGFFRGWLWASLRRAGKSENQVIVWTSVAFTLWHLSAISLDTGFNVPLPQIPVYLVNATLIGLIWAVLRKISGSVVVPSVAHAVWNGIAYPFFGFGTDVGALGIQRTSIYGPEVGLLGIPLNLLFLLALWLWMRRQSV